MRRCFEILHLYTNEGGNTLNLIIYTLLSVIVGIVLVALGYWIVK